MVKKRKKFLGSSPRNWKSSRYWSRFLALPRNDTVAEKTKYQLCEKILGYQEDNHYWPSVKKARTRMNY